jgi:DNA-binding PadR family transcriptional regulator
MVSDIYRVIGVTVMISRYLFTQKFYNEKKKKPDLQLKILNELTKHESLSKSKAKNGYLEDHHYGEISEAFDNLLKKKLIEPKRVDTHRSGKPEKFYSITDDGLASIISDETSPENFWLSILRVSHNRSDPIDLQTFNDIYKIFISKHLKYAKRESILYLDKLNEIYANWLQTKKITDSSIITKVLEILVIYPNITAESINSRLVGISSTELYEVLQDFTMTPEIYRDMQTFLSNLVKDIIKGRKRGVDYDIQREHILIQHSIIVNEQIKSGEKIYRLSLLGILLFLTILLNRTFHKSKSIMYYYDKIAANCSGKGTKILPLIFGKWSLLKNKLGHDSLYNFDVILSKHFRSFLTSKSIVLYGYKELYQNSSSIVKYNFSSLNELYDYGMNAIEMYENDKLEHITVDRKRNSKKNILPLKSKLWEISELVNYMDFDTHEHYRKFLKWTGQIEYSISPIERLCNALTEEISIIYYLNLISGGAIHYADERRLMPFAESMDQAILPKSTTRWASTNLAKHLVEILQEDKEIRVWFNGWKRDIIDFQETVMMKMMEEPKRNSRHRIFSPYSDED